MIECGEVDSEVCLKGSFTVVRSARVYVEVKVALKFSQFLAVAEILQMYLKVIERSISIE